MSDTEDGLQGLLDVLNGWCAKWRVQINTSKTKIVHFRPKQTTASDTVFLIGSKSVERVTSYRYLGVEIGEHLDDTVTVDKLAVATSRAFSGMVGKIRENYDLGYTSYTMLFNSLICPILDYAYGAWGTARDQRKMDQIQERTQRFYCGLPRTAPLAAMTGDMGWVPGLVRRDVKTIQLYNTLVRIDRNRLLYKAFESDINVGGEWSNNVMKILNCIEMGSDFESRIPVNLDHARTKLMGQYKQQWKLEVSKKVKLENYHLIVTT